MLLAHRGGAIIVASGPRPVAVGRASFSAADPPEFTNSLAPALRTAGPLSHPVRNMSMTEPRSQHTAGNSTRRSFLQTSAAATLGGALAANLSISRAAHAAGSDVLRVGLVGCGGRGNAAALEALGTEGPVTLWAMADAFAEQVEKGHRQIANEVERRRASGNKAYDDARIDCPPERQFTGLDAYQKAIDLAPDDGPSVQLEVSPVSYRISKIRFISPVDQVGMLKLAQRLEAEAETTKPLALSFSYRMIAVVLERFAERIFAAGG